MMKYLQSCGSALPSGALPAAMSSNGFTTTSRHIAVIGAGASGLVAARELRRQTHTVVVFERSHSIGGTWLYNPETESDQLGGFDRNRRIVHASLYDSLRTNIPRECMGFLDYPFVGIEDHRRFPHHKEVLRYLQGFARDFGIEELVRFGTEVVGVEMGSDKKWVVKSKRVDDVLGEEQDPTPPLPVSSEVYDGVVICNGHYTEPRIAEIQGIMAWPGKQLHSHNYRVPEPFADQVMVLIGASASAVDISRDLSRFAKEVHVVSRSEDPLGTPRKVPGYDNMWIHPMIERANEDGTILFYGGNSFRVDTIMHCTGYKYHFPFLKIGDIVTVDDNRVGSLYKHVFPPSVAPGLSFIGLPWKVLPFPMFELQSKWVAMILSGEVTLPMEEDMVNDVNEFYNELESIGCPKRYTHNLAAQQFKYNNWLAMQCGYPAIEEWRKGMYEATSKNRIARPETYRDVWDDGCLAEEAQSDFNLMKTNLKF